MRFTFLIKRSVIPLLALLLSNSCLSAELKPGYFIQPKSKLVTAVGAGLSNGMIGFRYSQWLRDPAIIVNAALGLEGWVAGVRLPVQNLSDFDLVIDFSGLFTPGILGMLTDSDGGIIFSDHSALVGAGLGIQRWVKNSRDYSLYIYAGVSYWFQVSGNAEGNDDRLLGPELQLGVSY